MTIFDNIAAKLGYVPRSLYNSKLDLIEHLEECVEYERRRGSKLARDLAYNLANRYHQETDRVHALNKNLQEYMLMAANLSPGPFSPVIKDIDRFADGLGPNTGNRKPE